MKKIILLIVSVCLLASVLCLSVFAAGTAADDKPASAPAKGVVLRISAEKNGKQYPVVVEDHTNFEDGWNAAMKLAADFKELNKQGYKRVIVDLYSDWKAVDGEFSDDLFNGKGFNWDTIYFPSGVDVTLNLNGHTVDRGLTAYQYNGEVMYVDSKANVTINNGTIKGGWSCNGAGGIHVNGAIVKLNNVNLIGNTVEDDDGAAIALYSGATLIMNGGSISENIVYNTNTSYNLSLDAGRGVLYAKNSHVQLENVTFRENVAKNGSVYGLVGFFVDSIATINNCAVENNGYVDGSQNYVSPLSLFYSAQDIDITIKNTQFKHNGAIDRVVQRGDALVDHRQTSLINFETHYRTGIAYATIEKCTFTGNKMDYLFDIEDVELVMKDCTVTDNWANVAYDRLGMSSSSAPVKKIIEKCTFRNNAPGKDIVYRGKENPGTFCFSDKNADVNFVDCNFANSTFTNKDYAKFKNSSVVGSVFNEDSAVMIVSIVALVASVTSIALTVVSNKKKKAVAVNNDNEE